MTTIAVGTNVRVVSVEGEVDLHTAPQLDALLRSMDADRVILDLTEAAFMDSTTLGILVGSHRRMRDEGTQLSIAAGNPTVARLFELTGFDRALDVHSTLVEAIESALDHTVETVEAHRQEDPAR